MLENREALVLNNSGFENFCQALQVLRSVLSDY